MNAVTDLRLTTGKGRPWAKRITWHCTRPLFAERYGWTYEARPDEYLITLHGTDHTIRATAEELYRRGYLP